MFVHIVILRRQQIRTKSAINAPNIRERLAKSNFQQLTGEESESAVVFRLLEIGKKVAITAQM
jgi:hypothetical protein